MGNASSSDDAHLENRLLAALRTEDYNRLRPHLQVVPLERGRELLEPGEPIRHAYFLHSGVVSLVAAMADGTVAEMTTIGREGVVGFEALAGTDFPVGRALVQVSGTASRLELVRLRRVTWRNEGLDGVLGRYQRALLQQTLQGVACNRAHELEERCCRLLLMTNDRAAGDTFDLTQEFLAMMLGVRRPTVTAVAHSLRNANLIRYSRGVMTIIDRRGLEKCACECYGIIRQTFKRLLPLTYARD
jgi:CRP-like cAMP-binding protein